MAAWQARPRVPSRLLPTYVNFMVLGAWATVARPCRAPVHLWVLTAQVHSLWTMQATATTQASRLLSACCQGRWDAVIHQNSALSQMCLGTLIDAAT